MPFRNTSEAWGRLHQTIHWFIAIAAVSQLAVGVIFANLPEHDPRGPALFATHGTLGVTIFVVMLIRLAWRLSNPVPHLPDTLRPFEKRLARGNHWLLYLLLIGMPIGGYLMVNAYGDAVQFLDWKLPVLIGKNDSLAQWIFYGHATGAALIVGLVVLHVAAALRHEFILHDNVLRRMMGLPSRSE